MSCWVKSGSEAAVGFCSQDVVVVFHVVVEVFLFAGAVVADGTLWIEGDAKMDIGEQRK
jgi:hypothetical protein